MNDKIFGKDGLAQGRDLTIESFRKTDIIDNSYFKMRYDIQVKDSPIIRPKLLQPPQPDVFLNYLEWKSKQPFFQRKFLP